jgi:hypothetical protein
MEGGGCAQAWTSELGGGRRWCSTLFIGIGHAVMGKGKGGVREVHHTVA